MKKVIISRTSWHAVIYKWFFQSHIMPKSLCTYFWDMVFVLLCLIPIIVLSLPSYIISYIFGKKEGFWYTLERSSRFGQALMGAAVYMGIWCTWNFFVFFAKLLFDHLSQITVNNSFGMMFTSICLLTLIGVVIRDKMSYYGKNRKDQLFQEYQAKYPGMGYYEWLCIYNEKHDKKWLIIIALKAWWKNACPLIDWKQ